MFSNKITETTEQIEEIKRELKRNRNEEETNTKAWKAMEEVLGKKITEYDEKIDKVLKEYETIEEIRARRDRDEDYRKEMRFLREYESVRRWQEGNERADKEDEERREVEEERQRMRDEEEKWYHAYYNADFKTIGYRWIPVYYVHKPFAMVNYLIKGREVPMKDLGIAFSLLTTYLSIIVLSSFNLIRYLWRLDFDELPATRQRLGSGLFSHEKRKY